MFDIGFTEILLIGVVALIVVGPEKLPSMVRTVLSYVRQIKAGFSHIRDEVERELSLDEIKKDFEDGKSHLSQAVGYDELHDSLNELKQEADELHNLGNFARNEVSDADIEADLANLNDSMKPALPDGDAEADTGVEQHTVPTQQQLTLDLPESRIKTPQPIEKRQTSDV